MKRQDEPKFPRIRSTCEHGLPKLVSAERWMRLAESETSRTDPSVVGGLSFAQGQLCVIYFSFGVYRAMPVSKLMSPDLRKRFLQLFSEDQRNAVGDLIKRVEAGEWAEKADTVWREYQREQSYAMGF